MTLINILIFTGIAYIIGAIPTAYLFARFLKDIDIRNYGSGNVGATNAMRLLGKLPGAMVLVIDVIKGILVVTVIAVIAQKFLPDAGQNFIKALFGLAAVLGHNWTPFLGFKGGKGVATSAGVMLGISPWFFLVAILIFAIVVYFTRYVSLGSMAAAICMPVSLFIFGQPAEFIILTAILCILIVFRHKENIKRLLRGDERKIFAK